MRRVSALLLLLLSLSLVVLLLACSACSSEDKPTPAPRASEDVALSNAIRVDVSSDVRVIEFPKYGAVCFVYGRIYGGGISCIDRPQPWPGSSAR